MMEMVGVRRRKRRKVGKRNNIYCIGYVYILTTCIYNIYQDKLYKFLNLNLSCEFTCNIKPIVFMIITCKIYLHILIHTFQQKQSFK